MVCKRLLAVAIFQPVRHFSAALYQTFPLPLSPGWSHSLGFEVTTTLFPGLGVSVRQFWLCNNYKILAKCKIRVTCLEMVVVTGGTQPLPCVQSAWLPDPDHRDGTHLEVTFISVIKESPTHPKSDRMPPLLSSIIHLPLSIKSPSWAPPWRRGQNSIWFCELSCKITSCLHRRAKQSEKSGKRE